jgi:peroxiredoxin
VVSRNTIGWVAFVAVSAMALVSAPYLSRRFGLVHDMVRPDSMRGQPAPDFTLESLDGKTIRLSDFHGKAVLLNFWATWCVPCKTEMPWFEDFQKRYGPEGLQILGIDTQDSSSRADISAFARRVGVTYPIAVASEPVAQAYGGLQFLPFTLYIDRDGRVVDRKFGLRSRSEIENEIKLALASSRVAQK